MMDNVFNFKRFVNLCRLQVVNNWKQILIASLAFLGGMTFGLIGSVYGGMDNARIGSPFVPENLWERLASSYALVFFLGLIIWGSFTFSNMADKRMCTSWLLVPATQFEKFLGRLLAFSLGYIVLMVLGFFVADFLRMLFFIIYMPDAPVLGMTPFSFLIGPVGTVAVIEYDEIVSWLAVLAAVQSWFVLGSSLWPKMSFLKTCVASIVIGVSFSMLIGTILKFFFVDEGVTYTGFSDLDEETVEALLNTFLTLVAFVNWGIAYLRFKEAEIINRW